MAQRALITGCRGTVGRALRARLEGAGWEVEAWDRDAVAIDDYRTMESYVADTKPTALFHLAVASQPTQVPLPSHSSLCVSRERSSQARPAPA